MFWFTSVTVKCEVEQDDAQYTEKGHSTYPGTMGNHGLWEGEGEEKREGGEKEERREGGEQGRRREGRRRRGYW